MIYGSKGLHRPIMFMPEKQGVLRADIGEAVNSFKPSEYPWYRAFGQQPSSHFLTKRIEI